MTLILGLKYDFGRGLLVMSDSMITNADGSLDSQKIHYGFEKQCILSGTGMSAILEKINFSFETKCKSVGNSVSSFRELLNFYEDAANEVTKRYKNFDSIGEDESGMFKLMFAVWNQERCRPEMFVINHSCIGLESENYEAMGSGASLALNILRVQWRENLSSDQCMRLGAYCIMQASEYVNTVSPPIQLGVIIDGKIIIVNYDEDGNFVKDNLQTKLLEEDAENTIKIHDESIKKWIDNLDGKNQIMPYRSQ